NWHAPFEHVERDALLLEVMLVGAEESGELRARRMAADEHAMRVAAVFGHMVFHPAKRLGDVAHDRAHVHRRHQAIIHRNEDEPLVHERPRLDRDIALITPMPPAAVGTETGQSRFYPLRLV